MYLGELPHHPPQRASPPGYQWVYETDGLSGLGRFKLRKVFRAITAPVRSVAKVAKKIVKSKAFKLVALATVAWVAAPWFIALAKTIGTSAATALVKRRAAGAGQMTQEQIDAQASSTTPPDWIADVAQAAVQNKLADKQFAQQQKFLQERQQSQREQESQREEQRPASPGASYYGSDPSPSQSQSSSQMPSWLAPLGIGAALLIAILK